MVLKVGLSFARGKTGESNCFQYVPWLLEASQALSCDPGPSQSRTSHPLQA
jgi:hypothetical protein